MLGGRFGRKVFCLWPLWINEWGERPLVADELVEFERLVVEVQDFKKITGRFRGICGICIKLSKKHQKIIQHVIGWTWMTLS